MLFAGLVFFEKQEKKIKAIYTKTERLGNFITRWYYDLMMTSLISKEELILFEDQTFHYKYRGGQSGTFDLDEKGKWVILRDSLYLEFKDDVLDTSYLLKGNRLYPKGFDSKKIALKKK